LILRRLVIILTIFICGCSSVPFRHLDYLPLDGIDPQALRSDFSEKLPQEFELLNSAIFSYAHFHFSALGITRVDTPKKVLNVVGFSHLGIMLFELNLDKNGKVDCKYALPEFTKRGDFASAVLNDIKKIYFDRVPSSSAEVKQEKYKVVYRERIKDAVTEYVFAGEGRFLAEKNYYEKRRKIWSVLYYEYAFRDGKIYPQAIMLRHHKYGYKLIIRLKEIR
jgi:hypothetical protein